MNRQFQTAACLLLAATLQLGTAAMAKDSAGSSSSSSSANFNSNASLAAAAPSAASASPAPQSAYDKLVDQYFDSCFRFSPNWATDSGIHDYDKLMPDLSKANVTRRINELKQYLAKFEAVHKDELNHVSQVDLKALIGEVNSQLLSLESIANWKRDPDHYPSEIGSAIFSLMKRDFAPLQERMQDVTAREKAVPELLKQARQNLENTPKIYTEIALEQLPGNITFFKTAVPQAFESVKPGALKTEFENANQETIKQLEDYQKYLKDEVLPKSVANFAIGKENYQRKLAYDEMVDEPLDKVLSAGYDELHRLQKEFVETAAKIDPAKKPSEVLKTLAEDHPKPDQLLNAVQNVLNTLHDQCKAVVTIPNEAILKVIETPPFMRATTFASMDTPGAFETKAKEAYYNVTLPEKDWDAKRTEEHMRFFSTLDLINTSVHEAYPGHYVQGLYVKQMPTKARKLVESNSNVEGWAHYCEQMMTELEPDNLKLKLVQLHDALLRACRYIVGIQMHTKGMTVEDAKQFFMKEGYQEPANALVESKRGTNDPTYLVYTLGKLQILSLRDEYKKQKGDKFDLKQFHNEFMQQGMIPVKLIREEMLSKQ